MKNINELDFSSLNKAYGLSLLAGLYIIVNGFYFSPSYGGIARSFYIFILLPIIISFPFLDYKKTFISLPWLIFFLPIFYLASSSFWVSDNDFISNRSHWYVIKPLFFIIALLISTQIVIQKFEYFEKYLIKTITIVALITGIISLWQYLPSALETGRWPRMTGMSVNHDTNVTASLYGLNIFFCTYGLVNWTSRWFGFLLVSLFISLLIVLLSQSKVPLLFIAISMCWLFLQAKKTQNLKKILPFIIFITIISLCVLLYFDRIPLLDRASSYSVRFQLWESAIEKSKLHWWFGHGIGNSVKILYNGQPYFSHSHNFVIDTLLYGGITGALLLVTQIIIVGLLGFFLIKKHPSYLPIVAWFYMGIIFLLTNGQQPLVKPQYIWFYYWLPMVFILAKVMQKEGIEKSYLMNKKHE